MKQLIPFGWSFFFLLLSIPSYGAERGSILVGCPLPLDASYGQNGLRGATLAVEQINAAGGVVLNGLHLPIKLEVLDTGDLDPNVSESEAMAGIERLITEKKVDVLVGGPARSEYGVAAMDVIARHDVVHLAAVGCYTPTWDMKKFASDPKKYRRSFRMSGSIAWYIDETKGLLVHLKKEYGYKKMFILTQDVLMCRDAAELVKKAAVENGWEIVGQESNPTETTDFSASLTKCKRSGAQVLFLWSYSPNTAFLFEQWRTMEIPALPLGFVEAAEDPDFWNTTNGKCAYSVITLSEAGTSPSDVTPLSRKFYQAYEKRWKTPPRSTGSAAAYEAVFAIKDAVERAGTLETDSLIEALEQTDLQVVRGRLRFDQNHQSVFGYDPNTAVLGNWAQWQDGQRVTVWPLAARTGKLKMPPWLQWWWLKTR